jgi:hypothetical protein
MNEGGNRLKMRRIDLNIKRMRWKRNGGMNDWDDR